MVTNEKVLERILEKTLELYGNSIEKRRNERIGRVSGHGGFLGLIIREGCVEGKNSRGRPRMEYDMRQKINDRGCSSYEETKWKASNREEWMIPEQTDPRIEYKKRRPYSDSLRL